MFHATFDELWVSIRICFNFEGQNVIQGVTAKSHFEWQWQFQTPTLTDWTDVEDEDKEDDEDNEDDGTEWEDDGTDLEDDERGATEPNRASIPQHSTKVRAEVKPSIHSMKTLWRS